MVARAINSHDRLQRKCPNWVLSPSVCVLCFEKEESIDHIFIHCPFALKGWSFLLQIFGFTRCMPSRIDDWLLEALQGWHLKGKAKILWNCAARALLWNIWLERNYGIFEDKSSSFDTFCNSVQLHSS